MGVALAKGPLWALPNLVGTGNQLEGYLPLWQPPVTHSHRGSDVQIPRQIDLNSPLPIEERRRDGMGMTQLKSRQGCGEGCTMLYLL